MVLKMLRLYLNLVAKISLKARLVLVLMLSSLVTFAMVGIISYNNIYKFQENRTKSLIQANLNSICKNIEDTLNNLGNISKQYAYENRLMIDGGIGKSLKKYIDYIDNNTAYSDNQILEILSTNVLINQKVALINSSNPIAGLTVFYKEGERIRVMYSNENMPVKVLDRQSTPMISKSEYITFSGIHKSLHGNNSPVLSVSRKMDIPQTDDIYVYLETNKHWYNNLFKQDTFDLNPVFLMTDPQNKVIFSENKEAIPLDIIIDSSIAASSLIAYGDYYLFSSRGEAGWSIWEAITKNEYDREMTKWLKQFLFIGFLAFGITIIIAMLIWRTVYRPIKIFKREIRMLEDSMLEPQLRRTRVKEFDELFFDFYEAKVKIIRLLKQIEAKEKARKELEIEKLLIQINPHFIHNTLNSIQWMARLSNQKEIERMVSIFAKVLNFNLGKKSIIVTLNEELNALRDYIDLQKIRYQSTLNVCVHADNALMDLRIPRFIMQPLVENAIYHGMKDEGMYIEVHIDCACEGMFRISVCDDGEGMTKEQIEQLLSEEKKWDKRTGYGIGLKYVDRMLKFYYGDDYGLCIQSEKGKGTSMLMELPLKLKEETYD